MPLPSPALPLPARAALAAIPAEIRREADALAREWNDGWRGHPDTPSNRWRNTDAAHCIEDEARKLLERVSTLLTGDAEALGETRDELGAGITYNESLYVLCLCPDAVDVPRWLAAAAAYAAEARS